MPCLSPRDLPYPGIEPGPPTFQVESLQSEPPGKPQKMGMRYQNQSQEVWKLPGFPGGSDGKEPACNVGDLGSIPELGRSPGEGCGNPLQYSCLQNSDKGTWGVTVRGITKSGTPLSDFHFTSTAKIVQEEDAGGPDIGI